VIDADETRPMVDDVRRSGFGTACPGQSQNAHREENSMSHSARFEAALAAHVETEAGKVDPMVDAIEIARRWHLETVPFTEFEVVLVMANREGRISVVFDRGPGLGLTGFVVDLDEGRVVSGHGKMPKVQNYVDLALTGSTRWGDEDWR
jgi:hypothetical protein